MNLLGEKLNIREEIRHRNWSLSMSPGCFVIKGRSEVTVLIPRTVGLDLLDLGTPTYALIRQNGDRGSSPVVTIGEI